MKLERKDITRIYERLKGRAFRAYSNGSYNKSLKYIYIAARVAYKFSWIFTDEDLELLMMKISKSLFIPVEHYKPKANNYVFFDSISLDNVGLSQQYIRALIGNNINFLYISDSTRNLRSKNIFWKLKNTIKLKYM